MLQGMLRAIAAITLLLCGVSGAARAETCTAETLRRVVDEAGARLRVLTAETQPRIMASVRRLKEQKGWAGGDGDEKASALMSDARTAELDSRSAALLARIDELAEVSGGATADCARLAELEATSLELQATVRAKSQHILARLEQEAGGPSQAADAAAPQQSPAPVLPRAEPAVPAGQPPRAAPAPAREAPPPEPAPRREANVQPPVRTAPSLPPAPAAPPVAPQAKPKPPQASGWSTETSGNLPQPPSADARPATPSPLPPVATETSDGFSREEIAEASRGFFGTISGGLGSVIEHAFSTLGRPTGYVLGSEGGGAFIAGLRYGKGTLFLRNGAKREVFWHGPSIGYDFGASGSKTLFLVYNLKSDLDIFTGYSGVDGSAYLVGGVGMTILTDGRVVMAPIRSGLGVRLGANIGYIRFTARPTWNPF